MKNDKYPIKVAAVKRLESGESANRICKELHIGPNSLSLWYSQYQAGGELSLLHKAYKRQCNVEEKMAIIKDILNNNLSLQDAAIKYSTPKETFRNWLKAYRVNGEKGLVRKNASGTMTKKKAYTAEQLDELEMLRRRNEYLEAENALLKKVKALVEEREARLRAIGRKPSKD